ncbi:POM121-like protein 12 [Glossophaga mutica]
MNVTRESPGQADVDNDGRKHRAVRRIHEINAGPKRDSRAHKGSCCACRGLPSPLNPPHRADLGAEGSSAHARALSLRPDANRHPSLGRFAGSESIGIHRDLLEVETLFEAPSLLTALMGSYLSSPQSTLQPLAQGTPNLWPGLARVQEGDLKERCIRARPFPQTPRHWGPAKPQRGVTGAWMRLPAASPPETAMGPDPSCAWESYKRWRLVSTRPPRRVSSPVTIKIAPLEPKAGLCAPPEQRARPSGSPPTEKPRDPCAKETVLRALSQCKKGKRKFDGPLWFEIPESSSRTRGLERRPSAFTPLVRNGVAPHYVPRPGPLERSLCS